MALADRRDPYLAFDFAVEIDGLVVAGFQEVTGLQAEIETFDYREGGENGFVHRLPSGVRYPTHIVLRRGLTDSDALWNWHADTAGGKVTRRNGSIVLLDSAAGEVWRWNFVDAYPVRWNGAELRAGAGAVAVESLELVHRGLARG